MTRKIFRSILVVSIVSFLVSAIIIPVIMWGYFEGQIKNEINTEVSLVAAGVQKYGVEYFKSIDDSITAVWKDKNGDILCQSGSGSIDDDLLKDYVTSEFLLADGSTLVVLSSHRNAWAIIFQELWIIVIALLVVLLFSVILAKTLSKKIVQSINRINLEDPQVKEEYVELSPLLHRIKRQNDLITLQLDDLKRRKQEFEGITENMGEALVVIDNSADIITYNKTAESLFDADVIGYGVNVFKINSDEEFVKAVGEALSGIRCQFEFKQSEKVIRCLSAL
ncbi:MAG: hypothetical protein IKL36_06175 [Clostridia bacterium]|nr:hypothetical protein [Clostridia bacterium]